MPLPWSYTEVELIIADYFSMLEAELRGETYTKAAYRKALLPLLSGRSDVGNFKEKNMTCSGISGN